METSLANIIALWAEQKNQWSGVTGPLQDNSDILSPLRGSLAPSASLANGSMAGVGGQTQMEFLAAELVKAVQAIAGKSGTSTETKSDDDTPKSIKDVFETIEKGARGAVENIKVDFTKLGASIKNIFKSIGQGIQDALSKMLNGLISNGLEKIFGGLLGGLVPTKAAGGRIQPGRVTLVGERGPELVVPDRVGTVMTAIDTGRLLAGKANEGQAAARPVMMQVPETKVIINNHSGAETRSNRRRGPDGGDIIDIVIGRVAENLARGGEIADAAANRFGLSAQGT